MIIHSTNLGTIRLPRMSFWSMLSLLNSRDLISFHLQSFSFKFRLFLNLSSTASWPLEPPQDSEGWRHVRLQQAGKNASGQTHYLSLSGFEVYGTVIGAVEEPLGQFFNRIFYVIPRSNGRSQRVASRQERPQFCILVRSCHFARFARTFFLCVHFCNCPRSFHAVSKWRQISKAFIPI